jgi:hypothetical protein
MKSINSRLLSIFVRLFPGICLSMKFLFVDTATLCPKYCQRKLEWRAITDMIWGTVCLSSRNSVQVPESAVNIISTAQLVRKATFIADQELGSAERVLMLAKLLFCVTSTRAYPKVSGLDACNKNCKWYSSLPLVAVVSLFCESF